MAVDAATEAVLRAFAAERRYHPETVARWLRLAPADAGALLDLAKELRLGEHQLCDLWIWAEEVGARERSGVAGVLAHTTVTAARRRPVGRNDRVKLVKGALRRLRFPQLSALEDQLAGEVRRLELPANVRVTLPDNLEGDTIRIDITAGSAAALRAAAAAVIAATDSSACARLFELLAEAS